MPGDKLIIKLVRTQWKALACGVLALALAIGGIFIYQRYIQEEIYRESSQHLLTTYEQVGNSFSLFTQRNFNVLTDCDRLLSSLSATDEEDANTAWRYLAAADDNWSYSDLYLFNEDLHFVSDSGREGKATSIANVFDEMYETNKPLTSSYIASNGVRKIVFAIPLSNPFSYEGHTYTGIAISFDNDIVTDLVAANIYGSSSDCYVVSSDGSVRFTLEAKTQFKTFIVNMFTFLGGDVVFRNGSLDQVQSDISQKTAGSAAIAHDDCDYYLVYQPLGDSDFSLVAAVDCDVVDKGMETAVRNSMTAFLFIAAIIVAIIVGVIVIIERHRIHQQEEERAMLERIKTLTEQLFSGMTQIVDRFVVADLAENTYEYHERVREKSYYPATGAYTDLVDSISRRYSVLGKASDVKMYHLLEPVRLRSVMRKGCKPLKIEYCVRNEDMFALMHVVPIDWDTSDRVTKVMLIVQDIGEKVELRNAANTDGLTGLFNERYFSAVLKRHEADFSPFTLFYLDLDRFKPVNDTYGHDMGDKLLRAVADRISRCMRQNDFAFRIGGDEFAVVVARICTDEECESVVARVRDTLEKPYEIDGLSIEVGASCGWARYPEDGDPAKVRITADKRMYAMKELRHQAR